MDSLTTHNAAPKTQSIYYWLDGYWIRDKEEAELMDSINAFGSVYQVTQLPLDVDIDAEVRHLLKQVA